MTDPSHIRALGVVRLTIAAMAFVLVHPVAAQEQDGPIRILIEQPRDIGLEGYVRTGTWAPIRVKLTNDTPQVRKVAVEWIMPDMDGDLVLARREPVVINPNGTALARLYAAPPLQSNPRDGWRLRVIDLEDDSILTATTVAPVSEVPPRVGVIGITGGGLFRLDRFRDRYFQHEQLELIASVDPLSLPDRWYGMDLLDTLIWTRLGANPTDPAIPMTAVRDWVRRGGHLVITTSPVDAAWSDDSLADLLPPMKMVGPLEVEVPHWLEPDRTKVTNITYNAKVFEADDEAVRKGHVAFLLQHTPAIPAQADPALTAPAGKQRGLIAAHQYGLGRVTLIGIDLTDRRLVTGNDEGLVRLWRGVFHWQTPAHLDPRKLVQNNQIVDLIQRDERELGRFIPSKIAMRGTAGATLMLAMLLFSAYWLLAGPLMFTYLKTRGITHHSWLGFGAVVVVFSVLSWAGAVVLRPGQTQVEHFSVVDIDGASGQLRSHSWLAVFVPRHGRMEIALDTGESGSNQNLLMSAGLVGGEKGGFLDPQRYVLNTGSPGAIPAVPIRATAKQFEARYQTDLATSPIGKSWDKPVGKLTLSGGFPSGKLTHHLPGDLTNLMFVYSEGDKDGKVWVWWPANRKWDSGGSITITGPRSPFRFLSTPARPPVRKTDNRGRELTGYENRTANGEGYLYEMYRQHYSRSMFEQEDLPPAKMRPPASNELAVAMEVLTFFDALAPPDFAEDPNDNLGLGHTPVHLGRSGVRDLDLTHLTALRRMIIIGHLESDSPVPLPLKVDGEAVDAKGWTTVRFILPVE